MKEPTKKTAADTEAGKYASALPSFVGYLAGSGEKNLNSADMLRYLYETTVEIMRTHELVPLLESILRRAACLAGTDSGCILLYNEAEKTSRVTVGIGAAEPFCGRVIPLPVGASGEVWEQGRAVIWNEYKDWEHMEHLREVLKAAAYFPLHCNGKLVGTLGIWHTQPQKKFTHALVEWLQQFVVLASLAYETVERYREAQRELEERRQAEFLQAALYRISEAAAAARNIYDLYSSVHRVIETLLPAKNFYIAMYDEDRGEIHFPYIVDRDGIVKHGSRRKAGKGLTEYVIRRREPLILQREGLQDLFLQGEVEAIGPVARDWMGMPLWGSDGTVMGVICVQNYSEETIYTERDKEILSFVSTQIAAGIERKLAEQAMLESEEKYRAIVEATKDGIFIYQHMAIIYANERLCAIFGGTAQDILGKDGIEFFAPHDQERIRGYARQREAGLYTPPSYEADVLRKDGTLISLELTISQIHFNGQDALLGVVRDITERKLAERLQLALYRISETASSCTDMQDIYEEVHQIISDFVMAKNCYIALYDQKTDTVEYPYFLDQFDLPPAPEVRGKGLTGYVIRTGTPLMASRSLQKAMTADGLLDAVGTLSVDWLGVPLRGTDNQVLGALVVQSYEEGVTYSEKDKDILLFVSSQVAMAIERKKADEKLRFISQYDVLTRLQNRASFEEEMDRKDLEGQLPMAVVVCDVDGLKLINDTLGHGAGDELLIASAQVLQEALRIEDRASRIGGDEFAVIMEGADDQEAFMFCERIRRAMEAYNQRSTGVHLSMSVGYAVRQERENSLVEVLKEADNHMYREKLHRSQSARSDIVNTVMKLLEVRDFITEGHGDRMQDMAAELARIAGMPEKMISDIRLLAQFHDIGKVGIPDHILFKPGSLSKEEREHMQRHAEIGYRIAQSATDLLPIADWVLKHHEWWNGTGYPMGLKGEDIPLACRILSIVDAYDAMTSTRPYREAMEKEEALAELRRFAGIQFDPVLVGVFVNYIRKQEGSRQKNGAGKNAIAKEPE